MKGGTEKLDGDRVLARYLLMISIWFCYLKHAIVLSTEQLFRLEKLSDHWQEEMFITVLILIEQRKITLTGNQLDTMYAII